MVRPDGSLAELRPGDVERDRLLLRAWINVHCVNSKACGAAPLSALTVHRRTRTRVRSMSISRCSPGVMWK